MKHTYTRRQTVLGLAAAAVLGLGAPALCAGTITNDMVVHLTFDNNYNNTVKNGVTASAVGAPTFAAGKIGSGALKYSSMADGSAFDYVTLGAPEELNFGGDVSFSVSFWAKLVSFTGDPAFLANKDWNSGGNVGWVLATGSDRRIQWNFRDGNARRDYDSGGGVFSTTNWHHLVITFDRNGLATTYADGAKLNETTLAPSADSLDSGLPTNIGQDGTGTYTDGGSVGVTEGYIDDVAIWRRVLASGEVSRLFTSGAAGINAAAVADPVGPTLTEYIPGIEATRVGPGIVVRLRIEDGSTALDKNSVELLFDGQKVAHTLESNGKTNVVVYDPPGLLAPKSAHQLKLTYKDNASPAATVTKAYGFTVADYLSITLPAPIVFENFDSTAEGEVPTGWTVRNFTDILGSGPNLDDPNSDSYADWVVIERERVNGTVFSARRLNVAPDQYVNGQLVTNLVAGRFAYAESDNRGGNQVQYLFSPDFNLTGKTDVHLSFHSIYEQNQDSIGAVEYSIDSGATWLPIVYMIDAVDILRDGQGAVDAVATLNEPRGDTARYIDPVTGEEKGGTYGAFIGAAITPALAPYISGRVNDDATESKRVEYFRLPQADNQAKVRFRFAQAGTASWYFGIDNFGLYSVPSVAPLSIASIQASGQALTIAWQGGAAPYLLQKKHHLADTAWVNVLTTSATSATVLNDGGLGFFRVGSATTASVIPLNVWLSGDAEVPAVATPAMGWGSLSLEGNTLSYHVKFMDLKQAATASHIHGPAASTASAGVLKPLEGATGTAGVLHGTVTLSETEKADLLAGKTYVNIHTGAHTGGELRGQIVRSQWAVPLTGAQEVPPVTTSATAGGMLVLVGNSLLYTVNYSGLSAAATAAHIHGPAAAGANAGVLVGLSGAAGTSGMLQGTVSLTPAQLGLLADGLTYLNIHTSANPGGEVRGQIVP